MGKKTRGNGQGTVFKVGNKWRVEKSIMRDGVLIKRFTKSGFKYKREGIEYLNKLNAGSIQEPSSATFQEIYDQWSAEHYPKIQQDTVNGYKTAFKRCAALYFKTFANIKASDIQSVIDACTLSRRTKEDIKFLITAMYKYATKNDICDKDYSQYITLPKKEKSKKDAFTPEEINKLWQDYQGGNEFTGYILVMIYTGMRYGEISKITRNNIDLENRIISGAGIKTDAGQNRIIPIADCIFSIIQSMYNKTDKKLLTVHEKVFYNDFRCTLERLGIRQLNPHCCRHTFFTLMATAGVPISIITETGGHTDYKVSMQYTHIHIDEQMKAVNALYVPSVVASSSASSSRVNDTR